MTNRKAPCPCGSGRKYQNCCYAKDRAREAPREAARAGLQKVDEVLKVFLPLIESRGEHKIACAAGCSACCDNFVRCSLPEALLVADWLRLPENADILRRFEEKLPAWRERAGGLAGSLTRLLEHSGGTDETGPQREMFRLLAAEYAQRGNRCPLNHEGRCEVYPVRPTICRSVHVVETSYFCTPGRGGSPKVVSHPTLEAAVQEATASFRKAAAQLSGQPHELPLPEAVAWALAQKT